MCVPLPNPLLAQTLYALENDFKAWKALVAAKYSGLSVKVVSVAAGEAIKGHAGARVPLLVTPTGALSESNSIARYLAKVRRDTELAGRTFFEAAQVDSWLDFAVTDLELPAALVTGPIFGTAPSAPAVEAEALAKLKEALAVLEAHLLPRTYLVGEAVTLADVVAACALVQPMRLVLDGAARTPFPSVTRWFMTIVHQAHVAHVVGAVELCEAVLGAGAAAGSAAAGAGGGAKKEKKEKAPEAEKPKKEEKPKKKKEEDEDDDGGDDAAEALLRAEPKKVDPFAGLAPSAFVMDEWKRTYSNSKVDYFASMPWFWEKLDRAGYSVWTQSYKYNADNKVDWMVSNTVGGFLQRCDEVRKYAFGMMAVLGDAAPYEIIGVWLIRGKSMAPMLEANPDAEYYDWAEVNVEDAAARKHVADVWCHVYPGTLMNKPIYDSKVRPAAAAPP